MHSHTAYGMSSENVAMHQNSASARWVVEVLEHMSHGMVFC